jgi:hypothetical protein
MKIALIPGSFKPYHAGHDALIRKAAAENDRVIVFYSSGDRSRPGELPVSGEVSTRIMKEYVSYSLPENVKLVESKIPVRSVFELLAEVDNMSNDSYSIYSDSDDIARYRTVSKYAPKLSSLGRIYLKEMTRGEDSPKVSGTSMRNYAAAGDLASFRAGLPIQLRESAPEIFKLLGGASRRPLVTTESISNRRSTVAHSSKNDIDRSTELMIKTLLEISGSRRPVNRVPRQSRNMKILEELMHSESLLLEFEGDGPSGYDSFSTSPNIFVKTFVAPFANVLNAGKALALDLTNVGSLVAGAVANKLKGDDQAFSNAMLKYRRSREEIKKKYWEPVKKFNNEALSGDAQILAFGLAPQAYVAANMLTTFKRVLVGKADKADAGIIGALADTKLLPTSMAYAWKDFKEKTLENAEIQQLDAAELKTYNRKRGLNTLKSKVPPLISMLLAAVVADSDKEASLKKMQKKLENGMELLSGSDIEELRRHVNDLKNETKKDKLNEQLDIINDAHMMHSRYLATRLRNIFESDDYKKDVKQKAAALKGLVNNSTQLIGQSFVALQKNLVYFRKYVIFANALYGAKDLSSVKQKLSNYDIAFEDVLQKLTDSINDSNAKGMSDEEKFRIAKDASRAALARGIAECLDRAKQQVSSIRSEMNVNVQSEAKNEQYESLKDSLDDAMKLMYDIQQEMTASNIADKTVGTMTALIREIDNKIKAISSKSRS